MVKVKTLREERVNGAEIGEKVKGLTKAIIKDKKCNCVDVEKEKKEIFQDNRMRLDLTIREA